MCLNPAGNFLLYSQGRNWNWKSSTTRCGREGSGEARNPMVCLRVRFQQGYLAAPPPKSSFLGPRVLSCSHLKALGMCSITPGPMDQTKEKVNVWHSEFIKEGLGGTVCRKITPCLPTNQRPPQLLAPWFNFQEMFRPSSSSPFNWRLQLAVGSWGCPLPMRLAAWTTPV